MIVNTLMVKVKSGREKDIPVAKEKLLGMMGNIDVLIDVSVHVDIRRGDASYDFLLTTKFNDMKDLEKYISDPYHMKVAEYIVDMKAGGASVCYEI